MDFKRYFGKIKNRDKKPKHESKIVEEIEQNVTQEVKPKINEEVDVIVKKTLKFVDPKKDPREYLKRYLKESKYKDWFNRNYPNYTIYDAVGLSISDYLDKKRELFPESENIDEKEIGKVEIGKTKAGQILELLGTPSTTSTINATTWYYVYSRAETTAFNPPKITSEMTPVSNTPIINIPIMGFWLKSPKGTNICSWII